MKTKSPLLAWLATMLVSIAAPRATAAVLVHGTASSTGEQIAVRLYADISSTPLLSFGVRVLSDPGVVQAMSATRDDSIWFLGDSGNPTDYLLPSVAEPGAALVLGAHMNSSNPLQGVQGNNVPLGTVVYGRVTTRTPTFSLAEGHPAPYADFVTTYGAILDGDSGVLMLGSVIADPNDQDLDGLLDSWEKKYFGGIENSFYSDDPDHDKYNNRQEQELGSDPTKTESNLGFEIVPEAGKIALHWTSFAGRTYAVEMSTDLVKFKQVKTGIEATPPMNTFPVDQTGTPGPAFYRVLLEGSSAP